MRASRFKRTASLGYRLTVSVCYFYNTIPLETCKKLWTNLRYLSVVGTILFIWKSTEKYTGGQKTEGLQYHNKLKVEWRYEVEGQSNVKGISFVSGWHCLALDLAGTESLAATKWSFHILWKGTMYYDVAPLCACRIDIPYRRFFCKAHFLQSINFSVQ